MLPFRTPSRQGSACLPTAPKCAEQSCIYCTKVAWRHPTLAPLHCRRCVLQGLRLMRHHMPPVLLQTRRAGPHGQPHLEALLLLIGSQHERALLGLGALALLCTSRRARLLAHLKPRLATSQGRSHRCTAWRLCAWGQSQYCIIHTGGDHWGLASVSLLDHIRWQPEAWPNMLFIS